MRLENFEVTDRAVMADPKDLEPLFKPVNGMRVIARPLEFVGVVVENDPGVCGSQIPADIPCREETVLDEMGQPRVPKARWLWRWEIASPRSTSIR